MKITIKTKNFEITEGLQNFIDKKIGSLKKFIDIFREDVQSPKGLGKALVEVLVELEKETNHHKKGEIFSTKVQINLPGKNLIASSNSEDLFKAIGEVRDELEKEIEKYKFKKTDQDRREQRRNKIEI